MFGTFRNFCLQEDGAVTVDFVVLTAAVIGLGLGVILTISNGATDYSGSVGNYLTAQTVTTTYD